MANDKITIGIDIIGKTKIENLSEITQVVKKMQQEFDKIGIKPEATAVAKKGFVELEKELQKYSQLSNEALSGKNVANALNTSKRNIISILTTIQSEYKKISKEDIIGTPEQQKRIAELKDGIKDLQLQLNSLASKSVDDYGNLSGLEKSLERIVNGALPKGREKIMQFLNVWKEGDINGATQKLEELDKYLNRFGKGENGETLRDFVNILKVEFSNFKNETDSLNQTISKANDEITNLSSQGAAQLDAALKTVNLDIPTLIKLLQQVHDSTVSTNKDLSESAKEFERLESRIKHFFSLTNGFMLFRRAVQGAFNTVKELDAVMTETAVVTDFSVSDMWDKLPEYTKMANELGATTKGAYETATLYYQQGLKTNEVMAVSAETMKMARIAGLDYATATDYMTAALRGFNMEINTDSAERVNDVYSRLAAITASNTQEISVAMTKVASLAHNANMEFETTAAFLAQIIETTRESAETAGTALKTVVARFTEVKKLYNEGELMGTDEEGEEIDVNKVATALRSAGIDMNKYFTGQVGLDDIFMELASKWDSLDKVQQRYIATMAAGSRQQSRFIAMMSNYKRTLELVGEAENSAGASQKQFDKTMESLEAKVNRLKNAWNGFLMGLANSDLIKGFIDLLTQVITALNNLITTISGGNGTLKMFITLLASVLAMKAGSGILKGLTGVVGSFAGIKKGIETTTLTTKLFQNGLLSLDKQIYKTTLASGELVLSSAAITEGQVAEASTAITAAEAYKLKAKSMLLSMGTTLLYVAAIAALVAVIVLAVKAIREATHPLETAQKQAQKLQDQFEKTRDRLKETNDALDELEEKFKDAEQFSNLPATFAEKMKLANDSLKEFIKLFPEFAKYYDPNTGTFNFEAAKNQVANEEAANNEVAQKADLTQLIGAYNQNNLEKTEESYNTMMYYLDQFNKDYGLSLTAEDLGRIYNEAYSAAVQNHTYTGEQVDYFDAAGANAETIEVVMRVVQEQAKENINFVTPNDATSKPMEDVYNTTLQSFDNDLQKQQFQQYIGRISNAGYGIDEQTITNMSDLINNGSIDFQGDTITSIEQYIAALQKLMEVEASDTENTQKLTDSLDNLNQTYPNTNRAIEYTNEEIEESAKHWKKEQKEVIDVTDSIEDYRDQLIGMDKDSSEYEETLEEMTETLQDYFNQEIDMEGLDSDSLNKVIKDSAEKLAKGEIEFEDVGKNLAVALASGLENGADAITFDSLIDKLNNLEAGATVEMQDLYDLLATGAYQTQEEFNAAMAALGIEFDPEGEFEEYEMDVPTVSYVAAGGLGGVVAKTDIQKLKFSIPKITTKSGNKSGIAPGGGPGGSKGSGGSGGGGGGGSNPDRWLNPYDKFYNLTEQINEALRQREKLERAYDRILKNRWSLQKDIQGNTQARLASLKQEIEMNKRLLAGRQEQLDAVLNEKFLDDNKNIRTFRDFGVAKYANYNTARGTVEIDWEGLERLSGTTDTQLGGVIEDFVKRLEELQDQWEDTDKVIEDLEDEVQEILDINKEEYLSFEQRVFDAIVDREQKLIDGYTDLSETISNDNEEVLNALSESIDLSRQIRDNTKTEEEIAEKEARLAYLRRDTSGANDLAIKQLEKELEQARESYGDTLIDQELDRLSQANEDAAKQRERQIEIMQAQLDWQQKVGFFWNEVINLLQNNYGQTDEGMAKELVDLLEATDAFSGMSEFQKADWLQKLHTEWLESESGHASWRLSEAKAASMGESGKESNYSISADQTTAGKALRYDYDRDMWLDEDEGWYTGVSYNAESNLFDYTGYSSKASRDAEAAAQAAKAQAEATKRSSVGVGSYINASGAPIYTSAYGGSPLTQYFGNDPKYLVLDDYGSSWMVRWHGLSSGITGFFRKGDVRGYKTGGLVNTTGPAWLDGTPQRPEFVLNADQTQAFMKLVDKLGNGTGAGDNYFDVNIVVDQISSDYDVDRLVDRIKQKITEDAQYRNVNAINWIR